MEKETYIVFGEWEEDLDDLSNEEVAELTRAFFKYVKRGEKPTFSDRMMRSCWRKIQQATDRADKAYQARCEKNRENGKKGGAPKGNTNAQKQPNNQNNRMVEKTTETTLPDRDRDRDRERDPQRDRGRGEYAPSAHTTTTTAEIIEVWNQQKCTQNIKIIGEQRRERTEIAVAVSGGSEPFLDMIRSLDSQAYFKSHKVDFDWFVDPKNFQNILEGKYADSFQNIPDGWEVIK